MGLSGIPGQACLGAANLTVQLLLAMDLGWLPSVLPTIIGICFIWT